MFEKLCGFSVLYCEIIRDYFTDEGIGIAENIKGKDILKHINPYSLIIDVPKGSNIAFRISFDCELEAKHGLEWLVNNVQVLYAGSYSKENPRLAEIILKMHSGILALLKIKYKPAIIEYIF